jgi:hypothetical protein
MNEMRNRGYINVMWLDASYWAIKPIDHLFSLIEKDGFFMENSGHNLGTWTSDEVLDDYGMSRDDAMNLPMLIAGGFGLSFDHPIGNSFLNQWLAKSQDGHSFVGSWDNNLGDVSDDPRCKGHRHDMSLASMIAHKHRLSFFPNNTFMAYYGWYEKYKNDPEFNTADISFLLQGM